MAALATAAELFSHSSGPFHHKPKLSAVARVARVAQLFAGKTATIPFVYRPLMTFDLPICKTPIFFFNQKSQIKNQKLFTRLLTRKR
jgi:hypothetical protein